MGAHMFARLTLLESNGERRTPITLDDQVNRWIEYPDVQVQGGKTFELANISNMFRSHGPSAAFDVESNFMN